VAGAGDGSHPGGIFSGIERSPIGFTNLTREGGNLEKKKDLEMGPGKDVSDVLVKKGINFRKELL